MKIPVIYFQFCADFVKQKLFQKITSNIESGLPLGDHSTQLHVDSYKNILTKQLLSLDSELLQASKEISDISGICVYNEPSLQQQHLFLKTLPLK